MPSPEIEECKRTEPSIKLLISFSSLISLDSRARFRLECRLQFFFCLRDTQRGFVGFVLRLPPAQKSSARRVWVGMQIYQRRWRLFPFK